MEVKGKRVYPSSQLVCALDAKVLKVLMWIIGWQNAGDIKYYPKQFAKACKMEEEEIDLCIQTLVDCNLLDVSRVDQSWILHLNGDQFARYYEVPISKVIEGSGIKMASTVTWNCTEAPKMEVEDMSMEEIQKMIMRLQISLNEKQQMQSLVKTAEPASKDVPNDLPF
jgi:hypothetical protein